VESYLVVYITGRTRTQQVHIKEVRMFIYVWIQRRNGKTAVPNPVQYTV
jgi:hypothetical protein